MFSIKIKFDKKKQNVIILIHCRSALHVFSNRGITFEAAIIIIQRSVFNLYSVFMRQKLLKIRSHNDKIFFRLFPKFRELF